MEEEKEKEEDESKPGTGGGDDGGGEGGDPVSALGAEEMVDVIEQQEDVKYEPLLRAVQEHGVPILPG